MTNEEKAAVAATSKIIRKYGLNAQRYANAGHKLVSLGNGWFRCVVCNVRSMSHGDRQALDTRCSN